MKKVLTLILFIVICVSNMPVTAQESFVHPGVLNTADDLLRIAEKIKNSEEPYLSGYNALIANRYANPGAHRAVETITRGGSGANFALLYTDAARAYLCAIRWHLTGDRTYGDCARDILNAWSQTLKTVTGNADRYLAAGIYGYQIAAASELMREYEGFEVARMQQMLINVFYKPLIERFLYSNEYGSDHNDAHIMNYWANWDLCNMAAATAIGVFCDRRDIYERALNYFKFGAGNGSVFNAIPKLYETKDGIIGQWQEAGRDFEHTQLGVGLMAVICEIAYNQGDDLYGWANNRFMYGAEYVARHLMGYKVPFTEYNWYSGKGTWSGHTLLAGAGGIRPIWEMIYNHYVNRMGYELPGVERIAAAVRPEGGAGGHASSFDQFGFGTLLYTREKADAQTTKLPESNVKEGVYRIISRKSGCALTDADGVVMQYTIDENNPHQLWEIADLDSGIFTITNVATGKNMSVDKASYSNAAAITTVRYEGKLSQQFAFLQFEEKYYDGYYKIVPTHSGLGLDVLNGSTQDGDSVIQYTYNSGEHQQWALVLVEEKDTYVPEAVTLVSVTVDIPQTDSESLWVFNAVYSKEGILERAYREEIYPDKATDSYTFSVPCYKSQGEYLKTYIWDNRLKPVK